MSSDPNQIPEQTAQDPPVERIIDEMRRCIDEEKKALADLDAKIEDAKEHQKQLRRD
jgi:hypothetical protein